MTDIIRNDGLIVYSGWPAEDPQETESTTDSILPSHGGRLEQGCTPTSTCRHRGSLSAKGLPASIFEAALRAEKSVAGSWGD